MSQPCFSNDMGRIYRPCMLGVALLASVSWGCGGDDDAGGGSESDAKAPYGPMSRDTVIRYERARSDGTVHGATAEVVGEKTIDGKTYWRGRLGEFKPSNSSGAEVWVQLPNANSVVVAGGEFWSRKVLPNPDPTQPSAVVELNEPVVLKVDPPMGQPVAVQAVATVKLLGQSLPIELSGSYTLVNDDVSLPTSSGALHGCREFSLSGTASNNELLTILGVNEVSGQGWYHPSFGLVRAVLRVPGKNDYVLDFTGADEMGKATSGINRIQGMRVLRSSERFELNTYGVHSDLDADKDKHAKMLVEARFADDATAQSSNRPSIDTEIGTTMGNFPHDLIASPISFFHPEENGKGYTFWIGYVDQGAKNEPVNGISYHITATVSDSSPVRVTSRIIYSLYNP